MPYYALFKPEQLVFDNRLLGNWDAGSGEVLTISKCVLSDLPEGLKNTVSKSYRIAFKEKNGVIKQQFLGFLVPIGQQLYMDYFTIPTPDQETFSIFYKMHFIPMHSLYKVEISKDSFSIRQLKESFLYDLINTQKLRIPYDKLDGDRIVVTAHTEELQRYVQKYGNTAAAFDDNTTYNRL